MDIAEDSAARDTSATDHLRLEALKLLADWAKWLTAIDTAAMGGLFAYLLTVHDHSRPNASCAVAAACLAMGCLLVSLWGACQFLFSLAGIVMDLPARAETTTLDLRNERFAFTIGVYNRIQYVALYPAALCFCALVFFTAFPLPMGFSMGSH